jgi:hypothetical protein
MINHTTLAIVAIIAALGLLGAIAIENVSIIRRQQQQQAFALTNGTKLPGCNFPSKAFDASKGRCFGH